MIARAERRNIESTRAELLCEGEPQRSHAHTRTRAHAHARRLHHPRPYSKRLF